MRIKVKYTMSAYIEADTLERCHEIWDEVSLTMEGHQDNEFIGTEYDELLGVYNADTLDEIEHKNW